MRGAYGAAEFLSVQEYKHLDRWVETISAREPVQRGRIVNLTWGPEEHRVTERHEAADIDKVRERMKADAASTRRKRADRTGGKSQTDQTDQSKPATHRFSFPGAAGARHRLSTAMIRRPAPLLPTRGRSPAGK